MADRHGNSIPEKDLLNDLRKVASQTDAPVTVTRYKDLGNHARETLRKRFGSWEEALQKVGIDNDKRREKIWDRSADYISENIDQFEGAYQDREELFKTFQELIPFNTFSYRRLNSFINYVNENTDKVSIRHTSGTASNNYIISRPYKHRMRVMKADLPEELRPVFDRVVGLGRAPRVVKATIDYLTLTDTTQSSCAGKYGATETALRQSLDVTSEALRENGITPSR